MLKRLITIGMQGKYSIQCIIPKEWAEDMGIANKSKVALQYCAETKTITIKKL